MPLSSKNLGAGTFFEVLPPGKSGCTTPLSSPPMLMRLIAWQQSSAPESVACAWRSRVGGRQMGELASLAHPVVDVVLLQVVVDAEQDVGGLTRAQTLVLVIARKMRRSQRMKRMELIYRRRYSIFNRHWPH